MDNKNLKANELEALKDIAAFINFGIESGLGFWSILGNVSHDIQGLCKENRGFLPRTKGYSKLGDQKNKEI
jgi:hypothetical protein